MTKEFEVLLEREKDYDDATNALRDATAALKAATEKSRASTSDYRAALYAAMDAMKCSLTVLEEASPLAQP